MSLNQGAQRLAARLKQAKIAASSAGVVLRQPTFLSRVRRFTWKRRTAIFTLPISMFGAPISLVMVL